MDYESGQCGLSNDVHITGLRFGLRLHNFGFGTGRPFLKSVRIMVCSLIISDSAQ
jgi:hypothetical protein